MSNKNLTFLGIVAVAMVILATVLAHQGQPQRDISGPVNIIQGLNPDLIARIDLGKGDDTVTLTRQGNRFVVTDKGGYPALNDKVNSLLTSCLDIKGNSLVTSNPDNHDDLEVTEDKAQTLVKFFKDDGEMIMGLVLGKRAEGTRGTYVRRLPGDDVYLSTDTPWISTSAMNFMESDLFDIQRDDIARVTLNDADTTMSISKVEGKITLNDIPAGKQAKQSEVDRVFNALEYLRFTDVKKQSDETGAWSFSDMYTCHLNNGLAYRVKLTEADDKSYIMIYADDEKVAADDKETAIKAAQFNQRHFGWVYEIGNWYAETLTKRMADLTEDVPEPEQPAEPEPAPAPAAAAPVTSPAPVPAAPAAPKAEAPKPEVAKPEQPQPEAKPETPQPAAPAATEPKPEPPKPDPKPESEPETPQPDDQTSSEKPAAPEAAQ